MEYGDAPLVVSWAQAAKDLFEDEMTELSNLTAEQRQSDEKAMEAIRQQATTDVDAILALRDGKKGGKGGTGNSPPSPHRPGRPDRETSATGKKKKQQQQQQQRFKASAHAALQQQKAARAAERAAMVEERVQDMAAEHERQPWRRLLGEYNDKIAEVQRVLEPVRARERRELDYFLSKPLEGFSMDDVMGTLSRGRGGGAAAVAAPARPSSQPASPAAPQSSPSSSSTPYDGVIIDAGAFAERFNEFLFKESGYKPVLTTPSPGAAAADAKGGDSLSPAASEEGMEAAAAAVAAPATAGAKGRLQKDRGAPLSRKDEAALRGKLMTHRPGLETVPPDFCVSPFLDDGTGAGAADQQQQQPTSSSSSLPLLREPGNRSGSGGRGSTAAPNRRSGRRPDDGEGDDGSACFSGAHTVGRASTVPRLPSVGTTHKPDDDDGAVEGGRASAEQPARTRRQQKESAGKKTRAAHTTAAPPAATTRSAADLVKGIECSVRERHVTIRTYTNTASTQRVRFTNRNINPTRLRLKPSTHATLEYRCVTVAPVAGSLATTTLPAATTSAAGTTANVEYSVETVPLSSGGYIDIDITFTPVDMSEAVFEEVLQVGVTREMNARDAEGAQWAFYDVAVTCQTVLPDLQLVRVVEEGCADGSVTSSDGGEVAVVGTSTVGGAGDGTTISCGSPLAATYTSFFPMAGNGFPPTFVFGTARQRYRLENAGSDCTVMLRSTSSCFQVSHPPAHAAFLARGEALELDISFVPYEDGVCEAELAVEVREVDDDDRDRILAEHSFELCGLGVVPQVHLVRIGDATLSIGSGPGGDESAIVVVDGAGADQSAGVDLRQLQQFVAKYIARNTTPEVETVVPVVVRNDSVVPLPYYWDLEATAQFGIDGVAMGGAAVTPVAPVPSVHIEPAVGVLLGEGAETVFHVRLTPHSVAPLLSSLNLFIVGLPSPYYGDEGAPCDDLDSCDRPQPTPGVFSLFRKNKPLPSALATMAGCAAAATDIANSDDVLADPFAAFTPIFRLPEGAAGPGGGRAAATFLSGLLLFARPVAPTVELMPPVLEETVECLTGLPYTRQVVLRNPSACPVHFVWDPTEGEISGAVPLGTAPRRLPFGRGARSKQASGQLAAVGAQSGGAVSSDTPSGVSQDGGVSHTTLSSSSIPAEAPAMEVRCLPRAGAIPANSSVTIRVQFVVAYPGQHVGLVPLYVPELDWGAPMYADPEQPQPQPQPKRSLLKYAVRAKGVGPSVHVSSELLDFGLIEYGCEAEASFTVTNDNPIPVVFDLLDPMMREPPRFVFIPASFRLAPGDSVEVTVYRKATSMDDARTYFELCVRDGGTIAVETRATIQKPTMMLDDATVNYGLVPEGVWQEKFCYLTNLSALDMPFTVEVAAPAPSLADGAAPCVEVELPTGPQMLRAGQKRCPVRVRARFTAAAVRQPGGRIDYETDRKDAYRLLLGIRSLRRKRTGAGATKSGQVLLLELCCDRVERLALAVDLLTQEPPLLTDKSGSDDDRASVEAFLRAMLHNLVTEKVLADSAAIVPYTERPTLLSTIPDDAPLCQHELAVRVANTTGCPSSCALIACSFAPLPTIVQARGRQQTGAGGRNSTSTVRSTMAPTALVVTGDGMSGDGDDGECDFQAPHFWTSTANGEEQRRREEQVALLGAQRLLLDGRGCVTAISADSRTGNVSIAPHSTAVLHAMLMSNLPGRYQEMLRLNCRGIGAAMALPVTWEVRGKPVLLDPTTSGLTTTNDGHDVLVMPPTVASLGSSRRTLKVTNRAPRDVNVSVEVFVSGAGFAVAAVNEDGPADEVVLVLGPVSDVQKATDRQRFGEATASPATFFMAAMSTREVQIEYTPDSRVVEHLMDALSRTGGGPGEGAGDDDDDEGDDRVKGALSQEVDWDGSLLIQAELAESNFNDTFLMDEFYELHRERYPSTRALKVLHSDGGDGKAKKTGREERCGGSASTHATATAAAGAAGGGGGGGGKSGGAAAPASSRSAAMLQVVYPRISRPGAVVRNSKLLKPSQADMILAAHAKDRAASAAPPGMRAAGAGAAATHDDTPAAAPILDDDSSSDSDAEGDGAGKGGAAAAAKTSVYDNPVLQAAAVSGTLRPLQEVVAEEEERQLLLAYVARRRVELHKESLRYFAPIELLLRARCGVPLLAVQPSNTLIQFPTHYPQQQQQTLRAGGRGEEEEASCRRTIRLTNENSASLFFSLRFTAQDARYGSFRVVETARVPQLLDESDARTSAKDDECDADGSATGEGSGKDAATFRVLEGADGPITVFRLHGTDALDVTVVYDPPAFPITGAAAAAGVAAGMSIQFYSYHSSAGGPGGRGQLNSASTIVRAPPSLRAVPAAELQPGPTQHVGVRVPLDTVRVQCSPTLLWFKPGQQTHDGRQQPAYRQRLQLLNGSKAPVSFRVAPRAGDDAVTRGMIAAASHAVVPRAALGHTRSRREGDVADLGVTTFKAKELLHMPEGGRFGSSRDLSGRSAGGEHDSGDGAGETTIVMMEDFSGGAADSGAPSAAPTGRSCGPESAYSCGGNMSTVAVSAADAATAAAEGGFDIFPMRGTIPAATRGGEPGRLVLEVAFDEFSNVRFEAVYDVYVDGESDPAATFTLRGDSRDTEL